MSKSKEQINTYTHPAIRWSKYCGAVTEDISRSVIGFIPNGLHEIYLLLKQSPMFGKLFQHPWVDQVIKLLSGITIGQGIASDLSHFIFRPMGMLIGFLIGSSLKTNQRIPIYQGQIGRWINQLSGPSLGGALCGLIVYLAWVDMPTIQLIGLSAVIGAGFGFLVKAILLYAIQWVKMSNQSAIKENVQLAKQLGAKLKIAAKQSAKSRILMQAQDIIQQVNGPQAQQYLEEFFRDQYDQIARSMYQRIERHFNYLIDRACHGDANALTRLQTLNPDIQSNKKGSKNAFEILLDRLFNQRAILKIKDEVDTVYDRWQYRELRVE